MREYFDSCYSVIAFVAEMAGLRITVERVSEFLVA